MSHVDWLRSLTQSRPQRAPQSTHLVDVGMTRSVGARFVVGAQFSVGSALRACAYQNQIETKIWKMFAFSL
jgi:hypothetical protein